MAFNNIKKSKILVEIKIIKTERLLNIFWVKNIKVYKIKKSDVATLVLEIDYLDYYKAKEVVEELGGRINIIQSKGFIFFFRRYKKKNIISNWSCTIFSNNRLFIYLHMVYRSRSSKKYSTI